MSKEHFQLLVLGVAMAASFAFGFLLAKRTYETSPETVIETVTDTLYVRDTISVSMPVWLTKTVISHDTVRVADTLRVHDTLAVVLEREQLEWRDTLCTVWASGVRPAVDSVRHYVTTQVVTNTVTVPVVKRTRWGVGIQAGYGISDKGLTPYIGAGLSYNILAW